MELGTDDGIRAARELRRRGEKGLIVYLTGFINYVQTGYEVRAFRHLLKSQVTEKLSQVLADIVRELSGEFFLLSRADNGCAWTGGRYYFWRVTGGRFIW